MYAFPLSAVKAGITRLRVKAGASAESLYDLVNAYINASRCIVPRPGSEVVHTLPAGTVGLALHAGKRHVFSSSFVVMTDPLYVCNVLPHPDRSLSALTEIHYAEPLLNYLFVVAEYDDGQIFYFWLTQGTVKDGDKWKPNTIYRLGDMIGPTVENGYYYRASRLNPAPPKWAPNVARALNDQVAPTIYNGYEHTVIDVQGADPRSGAIEPGWATVESGLTIEDSDTDTDTQPPTSDPPPTGGGGGDGGGGGVDDGNPYCVCANMMLDANTYADEAVVGNYYDCWTPERGFYRGMLVAKGEPQLVDCMAIEAAQDAGILWCSTTTPFTLPNAPFDEAPGYHFLAPQMPGRMVHADSGQRAVSSVREIGQHVVIPLSFDGGASFAAGLSSSRRIYSHNVRKFQP